MKVSITFDKNIKTQNKKQWLSQISSVVDRLNNRQTQKLTPKNVKSANHHLNLKFPNSSSSYSQEKHTQKLQMEIDDEFQSQIVQQQTQNQMSKNIQRQKNRIMKYQGNVSTGIRNQIKQNCSQNTYYNSSHVNVNKNQTKNSTQTETQRLLISQLLKMQQIMEQKFASVVGAIGKLNQKVNQIQKRVSSIEIKEQIRSTQEDDFDRQFAQISFKYDRMRRLSAASDVNGTGDKKNMRDTAASGFSSYQDPDLLN